MLDDYSQISLGRCLRLLSQLAMFQEEIRMWQKTQFILIHLHSVVVRPMPKFLLDARLPNRYLWSQVPETVCECSSRPGQRKGNYESTP